MRPNPAITIPTKPGVLNIPGFGKGWMVVDKPANLSVHNDEGEDLRTLLFDCIVKEPSFRERVLFDPDFGLKPVHRLDKMTSGLILFSTQKQAMGILTAQFESKKIEKRYSAIVHGSIEHTGDNRWMTWDYPISKSAGGRRNPAGRGRRVKAKTLYRPVENSRHYTLIQVETVTGRKHQIRKHARLSGHPIVGDDRYGTARSSRFLKNKYKLHRLGLHAYFLAFECPNESSPIKIEITRLPEDMKALLVNDMRRDICP